MRNCIVRRTSLALAISILAANGLVGRVSADNLNSPSWRGNPGTTFQEWEFSTSGASPAPDLVSNPYGAPTILVSPGFGQSWQDTYLGRQGVWPLSGNLVADIPNNPVENPFKDIWVQLTWAPQQSGNRPLVSSPIGSPDSALKIFGTQIGSDISLDGGWFLSTYDIRIEPNPSSELVRIDGGIMVDELVIDTICVPEPAIPSLLALSGLALLARRRQGL